MRGRAEPIQLVPFARCQARRIDKREHSRARGRRSHSRCARRSSPADQTSRPYPTTHGAVAAPVRATTPPMKEQKYRDYAPHRSARPRTGCPRRPGSALYLSWLHAVQGRSSVTPNQGSGREHRHERGAPSGRSCPPLHRKPIGVVGQISEQPLAPGRDLELITQRRPSVPLHRVGPALVAVACGVSGLLALGARADIAVISVQPTIARAGQFVQVRSGAYKALAAMPLYLIAQARAPRPHPCGRRRRDGQPSGFCEPVSLSPPHKPPFWLIGRLDFRRRAHWLLTSRR